MSRRFVCKTCHHLRRLQRKFSEVSFKAFVFKPHRCYWIGVWSTRWNQSHFSVHFEHEFIIWLTMAMYSRFLENERLDQMIFWGTFQPGLFYDSVTGQHILHWTILFVYLLLYYIFQNQAINIIWTVLWKKWNCLADIWWWTNCIRSSVSYFSLTQKRAKKSGFVLYKIAILQTKTFLLNVKTFLLNLNSFEIVMLYKLPNGILIVDRHFILHVSITLI